VNFAVGVLEDNQSISEPEQIASGRFAPIGVSIDPGLKSGIAGDDWLANRLARGRVMREHTPGKIADFRVPLRLFSR